MSTPHQKVSKLPIEAQKLLKEYFGIQEGFAAIENYRHGYVSPHSPIGRQWRKLHEDQKCILEKLEKMGVVGYYEWCTKHFTEDERHLCDLANAMNVWMCRVERNGAKGWRLVKDVVDEPADSLLGDSEDPRTLEEVENFIAKYKP